MNKRDKRLIDQFVGHARDLTNLECIILFGSLRRGEADKRSDIDLLLVFHEENPKKHLPEIMRIVTMLKPHREIRPTVTNLTDYDQDFLRTVVREGEVLWGKILLTPEHLLLRPYRLLSYDISRLKPSKKVKISRMIHGYQSKKHMKGITKQYIYAGLKETFGVQFIAKNTVLLPEDRAKQFIQELEKHHVYYQEQGVWVEIP